MQLASVETSRPSGTCDRAIPVYADGRAAPRRRLSRQVAADVVAIGDFISIIAGGLPPAAIYSVTGGVHVDHLMVVQATMLAGFLSHLCLRLRGLYDTSAMSAFPFKPSEFLIATLCGLIGVVGIGLPLILKQIELLAWYAAWLSAAFMLMLLWRLLATKAISALAADGRFDQRIAFYGAGLTARRVHDHLAQPGLDIRFAGVFDDRITAGRVNPEGLPVTGSLNDLVEIARAGQLDRIIISLPPDANERLAQIIARFQTLPVATHIVTHITSDLIDVSTNGVSALGPVGLLDVKRKVLTGWAPVAKRTEDIVLGSILLALTFPLWPLIAIAIKLESSGPVLFKQRRRGRYQSIVTVLKFRTMSVMEDGSDVKQATSDDPRVTRIGRFLRRTSLDELPQLFNVVKGDMSLVGPRPHALIQDVAFSKILDLYPDRHQMRPGMTGLAQVSGLRGSTAKPGSIEARVKSDLDYIHRWSIALDLKILLKTISAVVSGTNAD